MHFCTTSSKSNQGIYSLVTFFVLSYGDEPLLFATANSKSLRQQAVWGLHKLHPQTVVLSPAIHFSFTPTIPHPPTPPNASHSSPSPAPRGDMQKSNFIAINYIFLEKGVFTCKIVIWILRLQVGSFCKEMIRPIYFLAILWYNYKGRYLIDKLEFDKGV